MQTVELYRDAKLLYRLLKEELQTTHEVLTKETIAFIVRLHRLENIQIIASIKQYLNSQSN